MEIVAGQENEMLLLKMGGQLSANKYDCLPLNNYSIGKLLLNSGFG